MQPSPCNLVLVHGKGPAQVYHDALAARSQLEALSSVVTFMPCRPTLKHWHRVVMGRHAALAPLLLNALAAPGVRSMHLTSHIVRPRPTLTAGAPTHAMAYNPSAQIAILLSQLPRLPKLAPSLPRPSRPRPPQPCTPATIPPPLLRGRRWRLKPSPRRPRASPAPGPACSPAPRGRGSLCAAVLLLLPPPPPFPCDVALLRATAAAAALMPAQCCLRLSSCWRSSLTALGRKVGSPDQQTWPGSCRRGACSWGTPDARRGTPPSSGRDCRTRCRCTACGPR